MEEATREEESERVQRRFLGEIETLMYQNLGPEITGGVTISYCDEYNVWQVVQQLLESRLPLRNVEITGQVSGTHTIEAIDIQVGHQGGYLHEI